MEERLQKVLDAHSLACGAIIDSSGKVVIRTGDFIAFGSVGLVSAILGPYGSPEAVYFLVQSQNQTKPVVWRQGSEFAFLGRVGKLVAVVFGRDRGEVKSQLELSRLVGQSIAAAFATEG